MKTPSHNDSPVTAGNFTNVTISHADLLFTKGHRALEYTCQWCGGVAFFVVSRTSSLTGNTYADYACSLCARKWVSPTSEQMAIFHKAKWKRMLPGHREQFRERIREARLALSANLTVEQRRKMTAAARAKRAELRRVSR